MGLVVKPARAVKAAPGEPPLPLASADSATLSVVLAGALVRMAAPATGVLAAAAVRAWWRVSGVRPAEPGGSRELVAQEVTQVTAAPSLLVTAERGLGLAAPVAPQAEMPTVAMALLAAALT